MKGEVERAEHDGGGTAKRERGKGGAQDQLSEEQQKERPRCDMSTGRRGRVEVEERHHSARESAGCAGRDLRGAERGQRTIDPYDAQRFSVDAQCGEHEEQQQERESDGELHPRVRGARARSL